MLFDSGIRGGADPAKALALGADAVFVGRPYVLGLSVTGEPGGREVMENIVAELERVVSQSGFSAAADPDRSYLQSVG